MQRRGMDQLCLIATILLSFLSSTNAFSYQDAENWGEKYPECKGKHQSPIIYTPRGHDGFPNIKRRMNLTDFYKLPKKLTLKNTGHTVEMKADWSGQPPMCSGGPLDGKYVFEKATSHWSPKKWIEENVPDAKEGDSLIFQNDMDMQLFFYRTDFKSFKEAERQKGGLAVFKIGFQKIDDLFVPINEYPLEGMKKNLHEVRSVNSTVEMTPFRFLSGFDQLYTPFIFYEGSLDYPPCSESVTWFLVEGGASVSDSLVSEFMKIKLAGGDVSNVRPFQPLNKRPVKMVFTHHEQEENMKTGKW